MKFTKSTRRVVFSLSYIIVLLIFTFTYYIYYRTPSRVNWYNEMHTQSENLIFQFKDGIGN